MSRTQDMAAVTERQQQAITEALRRARDDHGVSAPECWNDYSVNLVLADEVRPGRGHDLQWWWADGEHLLNGYLDPYGNGGPLIVAETYLVHADSDDECECSTCRAAAHQ